MAQRVAEERSRREEEARRLEAEQAREREQQQQQRQADERARREREDTERLQKQVGPGLSGARPQVATCSDRWRAPPMSRGTWAAPC